MGTRLSPVGGVNPGGEIIGGVNPGEIVGGVNPGGEIIGGVNPGEILGKRLSPVSGLIGGFIFENPGAL